VGSTHTFNPHLSLIGLPAFARMQMFLVGVCVHIHPGSQEQLIIGFMFAIVVLLFTSIAEPFRYHGHNRFCLLCNFSVAMVLFFSLVLKLGVLSEEVNALGVPSNAFQNDHTFDEQLVSVALIFTLLASVIVASVLAVYQVYQSTRVAARAAAAERETSIARGRLSHPPTTSWELRQGNRYCMFLSHFKVEAGSDARYLSDLIKRKTGCATPTSTRMTWSICARCSTRVSPALHTCSFYIAHSTLARGTCKHSTHAYRLKPCSQ
jgi:hypothetical protein